jgi:F-box protein, helicase, 18
MPLTEPSLLTLTALTPEQHAILQSTGDICINAVAGSGKTTTLLHYAATRPGGSRILYLAFNKSVRLEARRKFDEQGLSHVQVETAHSLAYKAVVLRQGYKVRGQNYTAFEIAQLLHLGDAGERHGAFILANHILKFMAYFCNSAAQKVQDLNYLDTVTDAKAKTFVTTYYKYIVDGTRQLLKRMKEGSIEITHDFYLKIYQLSQPQLPFDYVLFDEGQDASPAMLDVFLRQRATKVIVGDRHQQIYSWRYAVNALQQVDFALYPLTVSFRFPHSIAALAVQVLQWKNKVEPTPEVVISGKGKSQQTSTQAIIARTNLGLLLQAIGYVKKYPKVRRLYFEGNLHSYTYADDGASLYDVLNLFNGKLQLIRDPFIQTMNSMGELQEYIEQTEDAQLGMMVEMVQEYGNEIPELIKELKSKHVTDGEKEKAEMIFSTVHRCKGMEYDAVQLAEDFITEAALEKEKGKKPEEKTNAVKLLEEINLLYVAITRTKNILRIPEKLLPQQTPVSKNIMALPAENETQAAKQGSDTALSFAQRRLQHKNKGSEWSEAHDDELRRLFHKGRRLSFLAEHFGCKQTAIVVRLKKLGCITEE